MRAYYDTGAIVPLFVEEAFSRRIDSFARASAQAIEMHAFHRLELENALRLKEFRREVDEASCRVALDKIASAVREGRLIVRPVDWIAAFEEARRLGAASTPRSGCRTLDLLHVAIAAQWESSSFLSADERQLRAARAAGLHTVDARALPDDAPPPRDAAGAVREKRTRYTTRAHAKIRRG